MRKFNLALLAPLLLSISAFAQMPVLTGIMLVQGGASSIPVTFVNGKSGSGTSSVLGTATGCAADTYCITLPWNGYANNMLYVAVEYASTGTAPTATTDKSQTFTALNTTTTAESSKLLADMYLTGLTSGTNLIKVATSGVKVYHVFVAQFAGVSGLDGSVKGFNSGAANNTIMAASITPNTGDLVLMTGCLAGTPSRTSFSAGTGQSGITWLKQLDDIGEGCMMQWGTWSGAGAFTPQMTTAGTASTFLSTTAAFTASTTTGTLPTGYYIAAAEEVHRPATATQAAAGNASYEFPSTGNLIVLQQACGNYQISTTTAITDAGNSGKWVVATAPNAGNTTTSTAYAPNAAADSNGAMTVPYVTPSGSNGDCDGYFYDVHGMDTVPNGSHVVITGDQAVAGNLTYISGYLPGVASGIQFITSSNVGNTVSGLTAPSGSIFQTIIYGGQNNDGPSLPGQNNLQGTLPFSSNSATTWTGTFSGADAAGDYNVDIMSFRAPGAALGIFGNQFLNSPTVTSGALSVTLTPRTSAGVLWAFVAWNDATHTMSCSDAHNGSWAAIDSPVNATISSTTMRFQTFWVANTTTSSITPTCTVSSGGTITTGQAWLAVHEILGVSTLDTHPAVASGTGSGTNATCGTTGTLASANEYVATGIVVASQINVPSVAITNQQSYTAGSFGDASGDIVVNATTSLTPVWTLYTSGDTFACAVNTFK